MSEVEVMAAEVEAHHANGRVSACELRILAGLAAGRTYTQLAHAEHVTVDAARHRASRAADKLDAQSVIHAVAIAIARGLIPGANA